MRGVTIAAIAASAAGKVSEDSYGHAGDEKYGAAWVLDGATGLGDRNYIANAYSDAAWYARQLSDALREHSLSAMTPEAVFLAAIRQVAKQWHEQIGDAEVPRYALPSAAGMWVRWKDNVLEAISLSDCRGWHVGAGGTLTQLGLLDEDPNDAQVAAEVSRQQSAGVKPANMRAAILESLRMRRRMMNEPDGYPIFSIHEETTRHLQLRRMEIAPGHIVLCSDGLFRWVDIYREGSAAEFAVACIQDISGMLAQVREIENADADCTRFPRLKSQDDATGIVLRVQV